MDKNIFLKVAITGKPNVGKSTFINCVLEKKVSITNNKPQTTRNNLSFWYENQNHIINFIDTPGFHNPKYKLDDYLNKFVLDSIYSVDLILLLIDLTRTIDNEDVELINNIKKIDKPVFVLFTKFDLINDSKRILEYKQKINDLINVKEFFTISSLNNNLDNLVNKILDFNKQNNFVVDKKFLNITDNDNFFISEIIREKCLELLKHEIPYGINVLLDKVSYDNKKNLFNIEATIVVEKNGHKLIVIGKNGSMIKQIGILSRQELLKIYDCKINLKLFVKVDKDWRNDLNKLKEFGYFSK